MMGSRRAAPEPTMPTQEPCDSRDSDSARVGTSGTAGIALRGGDAERAQLARKSRGAREAVEANMTGTIPPSQRRSSMQASPLYARATRRCLRMLDDWRRAGTRHVRFDRLGAPPSDFGQLRALGISPRSAIPRCPTCRPSPSPESRAITRLPGGHGRSARHGATHHEKLNSALASIIS